MSRRRGEGWSSRGSPQVTIWVSGSLVETLQKPNFFLCNFLLPLRIGTDVSRGATLHPRHRSTVCRRCMWVLSRLFNYREVYASLCIQDFRRGVDSCCFEIYTPSITLIEQQNMNSNPHIRNYFKNQPPIRGVIRNRSV